MRKAGAEPVLIAKQPEATSDLAATDLGDWRDATHGNRIHFQSAQHMATLECFISEYSTDYS